MNRSIIILLKEIREMLRDRRVRNAAFVTPVFMIVIFIYLFGVIEQNVKSKRALPLAFVNAQSNQLSEAIRKADGVTVEDAKSVDEALQMRKDGAVLAVVDFKSDFDKTLASGDASVTIYYDSSEPLSSIAMSAVRETVNELNKSEAQAALKQHGLSTKLLEPITLTAKDIQKKTGLAGSAIVGLIPYLIVLWAFYGGFSIVSDLVAGEKERGTLETLLVSPVTRRQVALGKFFSLAAICFASSMTTLVAVVVVGFLNLPMTRALFPNGLQISALSIIELLAILVPLVVFFAGILLSVSAYAKNTRESQTYLTLVSFLILLPAIFSQFIGFTGAQHATWVRFTPVLNSAVAIREALLGTLGFTPFVAAVAVSVVLGLLMLKVSVWLFSREEILTRV
ncbi:MAG TPA: ABC transporter permease [Fimbriimonadaceae bacterium]|nr:ABC transporter permease [Fimbriimonadaceae bacterium]